LHARSGPGVLARGITKEKIPIPCKKLRNQ